MVKYYASKKCKNCGIENMITAETGVTIDEECMESKIKCRNCVCLLVKEEED